MLIKSVPIFCSIFALVWCRESFAYEVNSIPVQTFYFDQKLDHFNASNTATWNNRYLINDEYYVPGGPIFLLINAEKGKGHVYIEEFAWTRYAKAFSALCILLDHRYLADHPTENTSLDNLKYLTIDQVLADIAYFIKTIKQSRYVDDTQKWIIFGTSYTGAVSIWFKEKYPQLVDGVVSSSATVKMVVNYPEFLENVSNFYLKYSNKCAKTIQQAFSQLVGLASSPDNYSTLVKTMNLCSAPKSENDISLLFTKLSLVFGDFVRSNNNSRYRKINVGMVCDFMLNNNMNASPLQRLSYAIYTEMQQDQSKCLSIDFNLLSESLKNTSWTAKTDALTRPLFYLQCNELGAFLSSPNGYSLFGHKIPLDYYINLCTNVFGPKYNLAHITKNVKNLDGIFHGKCPNANNVINVVGTDDPWRDLEMFKSCSSGITVIVVEGGAHSTDFYPPSSNDSNSLKLARRSVVAQLTNIIYPDTNEFLNSNGVWYDSGSDSEDASSGSRYNIDW